MAMVCPSGCLSLPPIHSDNSLGSHGKKQLEYSTHAEFFWFRGFVLVPSFTILCSHPSLTHRFLFTFLLWLTLRCPPESLMSVRRPLFHALWHTEVLHPRPRDTVPSPRRYTAWPEFLSVNLQCLGTHLVLSEYSLNKWVKRDLKNIAMTSWPRLE